MSPRDRDALFDDASPWVDRFGLVLLLTIVSLVVLSLVNLSTNQATLAQQAIEVLANVLVTATLLLALRASGLHHRWQRVTDITVIAVLGIAIGLIVFGQGAALRPGESSTPPVLALFLAALAPIVIIRRLTHHRVVTRGTLLGAVSAYLLIPVAFFYAFLTLNVLGSEPFFGTESSSTDLMYFSLSTITTVGYGDFTAAAPFGRMLANAESLIGQLYLVTFVGLLIGLLTRTRTTSEPAEAALAGSEAQGVEGDQ